MTIKEAFQQLANATKKGMKNPFFIMRSLNKNFSEIADKIEGGGSSDVEYSTDEKKIGKWIDGTTDVYEKTIVYETPFSIDAHVWYESDATYSDISTILHSEVINASGANYTGLIVTVASNKLTIGNQTYNQPVSNIKYVILRYLKTAA